MAIPKRMSKRVEGLKIRDFKPENSLKLGLKPSLNRCFDRVSRGDLRENENFCCIASADISTASQMVYQMPRACTNGVVQRSCCKFLFVRLIPTEIFWAGAQMPTRHLLVRLRIIITC